MKQHRRLFARLIFRLGSISLVLSGCGQSELVLPSGSWGGTCGDWYPEGASDNADAYGFEEEKTLPCAVLDSAMQEGEDTYISFEKIYLDAAFGVSDAKSVVIVVSAENCPACSLLIQDLADRADLIDETGAVMIDVTFCDNTDRTDCDFDLDRAVSAAEKEKWPLDRWIVTNDEDGFIRPMYRDSFPTVIVARTSDMKVVCVDRTPDAENLLVLLEAM